MLPDAPAISFENVQFGYLVAPVATDAAAAESGAGGSTPAAGASRAAHTASDAELTAAESAMIETAVAAPFMLETAIVVPAVMEAVISEPDLVAADLAAADRTEEQATERATERSDADAAGEPRPVLRGVSFDAPRGKRTALVGPSGAGKSTILALIERFYDPTAGVVRLGGLDIRTLDRTALRSQIGYVEQDAPVLAGSLRDNLTLSTPDATDEECIAVLHAVNLSEVLERDPAGLGAAVGESGVMLSGGERQRLAIARALLAAPPILLLDESTSSLDGVNEQKMRAAIDAVAVDRTLIVIAHRLSTVVDSDQIVVLDHGQVIGTGTHSELVASTPLYRELAKHQLLV